MKKFLAALAFSSLALSPAFAQQDPQFSQNMFNKMWMNPAAAGSNDAICASLLYRSQWTNYTGAPTSAVLALDAPILNNKLGVGFSVNTDEIGFEQNLTAKVALAYRMDLGSGKLGIGVDAGLVQTTIDGKFVAPDVAPDPAIPTAAISGGTFDLGAGAYYQDDRFYVGLSSTHLMESETDLDKFSKTYKRHYYAMAGYTYEISPTITLKPMFLVKNVTNNTTIDVNVNAHFNGRYWGGLSWRNNDAIVLMGGITFMDNIRVGYAYDYTTSRLKDYSNGSHEIMLGYCFNVKKRVPVSIKNVRFL
ncbi:MAG: type IX secretion system membrane protein PorP/SprF [Bacteroidota bacterium]